MKNTMLFEIFEDVIRNGNMDDLKAMNLQVEYPNWQAQFREYADVRQMVSLALRIQKDERNFRQLTDELGGKYFSGNEVSLSILSRITGSVIFRIAAAMVLVVSCIAILNFYSDSKFSDQAIMADYPLVENSLVRSAKPQVNGNEVKVAFADKNYNKVIDLLAPHDLVSFGKPDYILMLGASYYHTGEYENAIAQYRLLIENNTAYAVDGYMNIALTFIKTQKYQEAVNVLNEGINNPDVADNERLIELKSRLQNPLRRWFE
jgi:tetratricopeptide (TPR) repeat protein